MKHACFNFSYWEIFHILLQMFFLFEINIFKVLISLDPDPDSHSVRPEINLDPNCLQELSADSTCSEELKPHIDASSEPSLRTQGHMFWAIPSFL